MNEQRKVRTVFITIHENDDQQASLWIVHNSSGRCFNKRTSYYGSAAAALRAVKNASKRRVRHSGITEVMHITWSPCTRIGRAAVNALVEA